MKLNGSFGDDKYLCLVHQKRTREKSWEQKIQYF